MLFDRRIPPNCDYCRYGEHVDETRAVCVKRGIVDSGRACRRFSYDPLKRRPEPPAEFISPALTEEDMSL